MLKNITRFFLTVIAGWASPLQAQELVVDKRALESQQPTIGWKNSVPIVNITTPSTEGVSRNTFEKYNVGAQGIVFNNDHSINENLQGRAADIILTEVSGLEPSNLWGPTEIYGQAADFILANPNGICCDGAGFINARRITLTTGQPQLDVDGALKALKIDQGTIEIKGRGLLYTGLPASPIDILSRAVKISASLRARDQAVNIYTGSNKFDYKEKTHAPHQPEPAQEEPYLAIDATLVGNVSAGKITIIATAKGVGVNCPDLSADADNIKITAEGTIQLKNIRARNGLTVESLGGNIIVEEGDIIVESREMGTYGGEHCLTIKTDKSFNNRGRIEVEAHKLFNNQDSVRHVVNCPDPSPSEEERKIEQLMDILQKKLQNPTDSIKPTISDDNRCLRIEAQLLKNEGELIAGNKLELSANKIENNGLIAAGSSLDLTAIAGESSLDGVKTGILNNTGKIQGGSTKTQLSAAQKITNSGCISSQNDLDLRTSVLSNEETGKIVALGILDSIDSKEVKDQGIIHGFIERESPSKRSVIRKNDTKSYIPPTTVFSQHGNSPRHSAARRIGIRAVHGKSLTFSLESKLCEEEITRDNTTPHLKLKLLKDALSTEDAFRTVLLRVQHAIKSHKIDPDDSTAEANTAAGISPLLCWLIKTALGSYMPPSITAALGELLNSQNSASAGDSTLPSSPRSDNSTGISPTPPSITETAHNETSSNTENIEVSDPTQLSTALEADLLGLGELPNSQNSASAGDGSLPSSPRSTETDHNGDNGTLNNTGKIQGRSDPTQLSDKKTTQNNPQPKTSAGTIDIDKVDRPFRFLGDPFYESRLINDTILQAMTRQYLHDGIAIGEEQAKYLIGNPTEVTKDLNLSLGVALSKEQINALNKDHYLVRRRPVSGAPSKQETVNGMLLIVNKFVKLSIVDDSPRIVYEEENNRARIYFKVKFQNLGDHPINLEETSFKYTLSLQDQPLYSGGVISDRIDQEGSISLTKNDICFVEFFTNYLDDISKVGKDTFMQYLEEYILSLTFTVMDKKLISWASVMLQFPLWRKKEEESLLEQTRKEMSCSVPYPP